MADDLDTTERPNRYDAIDPEMAADTALENPKPNRYAEAFPDPLATDTTSRPGTFLSSALRGVLPTAGGMAAAGTGAEIGGAAGLAVGGPVGAAVGGLVGGIGGFFAGAGAVESAQEWGLHQLPDSWTEAIGQSDRAQRAQEAQHPVYSFLGGLAPYAVTMSPGAFTTKAIGLPENATTFQRLMANPITGRLFGGAAMGGMELGQEEAQGQSPDWTRVAISTGFGLIFNKPTEFGKKLTGFGEHLPYTLTGRIRGGAPVPPEGVLSPDEPTVAQAGDLGIVGPGATESTFRGDEQQSVDTRITAQNAAADEQAALGAWPTPDQEAVARRSAPELFTRNDELLTQRDALRQFIRDESNPPDSALAELAGERYSTEEALRNANQNSPDARNYRAKLQDITTQEQALTARRQAWEAGTAIDTPEVMLARQHLVDTEHALWDLGPEISAARRRAAEYVGDLEEPPAVPTRGPTIEGEAATGVPPVPEQVRTIGESLAAGPQEPAQKTPEQQRAFITGDRTAALMAAGMPRAQAEASAHVEAAYYETLAARFSGALGTAEDLYRARAARVVGPNGEPVPITRTEPTPVKIRTIADIQAQEKVSPRRAKVIQDQEILAKGRPIEPIRFGEPPPRTAPPEAPVPPAATAAPEPAPAAPVLAEVPQEPVIPPAARPRLRSTDEIMREDRVGPTQVKAVQDAELAALAEWQAANRSAEPRPRRNRAITKLADDTGIPSAGVPEAEVLDEIIDRLPPERVAEEIQAEAEAGEIEYREAEKAAEEVAAEVRDNPDAFYDSDQARPDEELEREHQSPAPTPALGPLDREPDWRGSDGLVWRDGDTVIRTSTLPKAIQHGRPISSAVLQPIEVNQATKTERMPYVSQVGRLQDFPRAAVVEMMERLRDDGFVVSDNYNANFGMHDGKLYVIDPGASFETQYATPRMLEISESYGLDLTRSALRGPERAAPLIDTPTPPKGREAINAESPEQAAAPEQRPVGGGEPEAAPVGEEPVPEGGGPPEPVGGAGGRPAEEAPEPSAGAGAANGPKPAIEPAGTPGPAAATGEPTGGAAAELGVAPLLPTAERPEVPQHTVAHESGLESLDPADIGVDAARFQFKADAGEEGVSDRLQGVQMWDPRLAGTALVWRDAEDRNWIADGHQRLGLAKRLAAEGQQGVRLNAFVLKADQGITDEQARVIAAAKNIAEGTGTAVDAAKVMRAAETAGIEVPPLPPRSMLVRDGRALARLSPDAFGMVVNDVVPINQGALVGRLISDHLQQAEAIRGLSKAGPANLREAELIVREVMETSTEGTTQGGLFGDEHFAASAVLERAKVASDAMRQLTRDRTTFRTLVSEAERIEGHGENVLDVEANQSRLTADERAKQLLTQLATRRGPISDALTGIARRVRSGEVTVAAGAREFLDVVRRGISESVEKGANAGGAVVGPEGERAIAPDAQDEQARDLLGRLIVEPEPRRVPEPTIRTDERQISLSGIEPSAIQAQAARDQIGRGGLLPTAEQRPADEGLFAPKEEPNNELFQTPAWEELLDRNRQTRARAQTYSEAGLPAAFQHRDGFKYLVSKDLNYPPAGWRVTMFNRDGEPVGHWEAKSPYEAFREVLAKDVEPVGTNQPPPADELAQRLRQTMQGKIRIAPGEVRSVITLARTADASTFMHETSHDWLKQLLMDSGHPLAPDQLRADAATVRRWLKRGDDWTGFKANGVPDVAPQEKFARGFEQYLREGVAPSKGLASVFRQFKSWLTTIYRTLRGLGAPINDDIRGVFDRMLAIEPERRTTSAEPHERQPGLGAVHATDATETEPHEAEAVADRMAAERNRAITTPPPEIANELATQEAAAGQPGGAAPTEPGGEAGAGAAGGGEVAPGGGQPEPAAPGGGVGAGYGDVGAGGGEAPAEGAGVSERPGGANGRRGAGSTPGAEQFAPGPPDTFPDTVGSGRNVDLAGNIRVENLTDIQSIADAIHDSAVRNGDFRNVRGGMTKGQMSDLAESMGLDPSRIDEAQLTRLFGGTQELGAKVLAARRLVVQSAGIVSELMKTARESGSDQDVAAMGVAIARHDMIQSALSGVTAEWGRAGNAFHSLLEGWDKAQDLNQLLKDNLGRDLYQLKAIAKMGASLDTPGKVSKFLRDAKERSFGRMLMEYWINGLISGPSTHMTYMVGNAILAAQKAGPETAVAAGIGALRERFGRSGERVRFGEVGAQLRGALREAPAAVQAGIEAARSGVTTLLPGEDARPVMPFQGDAVTVGRNMTNAPVTWHEAASDAYAMVQGMRDGLTSAAQLVTAGGEAGSPWLRAQYSPLGAIPDIQVRGVNVLPVGTLARLPSRGVAAIHSLFRAMNYSMDINALAYRRAAEEGLSGTALAARVADLRQNPTDDMMALARGRATDLTLMGQGGRLTNALSQFFNKSYNVPFLGETQLLKFVDPFVHIAGNIMNQSLMQRTPIGLLSPEIRADLAGRNGNIAQDTAMAKMIAGSALAIGAGGLAAQGLVSGSGPSKPDEATMWRLAGNQAHSVRIGDIWYDMHRLGPMGMLLSVAADLYDVAHQIGKEDADVVGKSLMHAFTQNILDESFMRGPADLIKATTDPGRYGAGYVRNTLASFMPYSVGMAQMARATDPYSRQARTIMDTIRAHTPGLSEQLLPRRDVWGNPMPNRDALGVAGLTSIWAQHVNNDPVNHAMLALGIAPAQVDRQIRNVPLTDREFDDFARIAGGMTKMRLDAIVQSPDYQNWPNPTRHEVIEEVIRQSREAARGVVMMKYPHIPHDAAVLQLQRRTGEKSKPIE